MISVCDLADLGAVGGKLTAAGMTRESAACKSSLLGNCAAVLRPLGIAAGRECLAIFVPGRIEVLGKHTDYGGGRSMLVAAERGFCAAAVARGDNMVRIVDAQDQSRVEFAITAGLEPAPGHWSNYPMTVARRLARNFAVGLRGADIAFGSDLPRAAGMSSSSALIVLSYLILARINRLQEQPEHQRNIDSRQSLAGYLGTIENGQSFASLVGDKGVGTFGGSEDHTAILCCKPGKISQYAYCPVRFERCIDVPSGHIFAVGVSGVVAEKTGQARERYNRISRITSGILRLWNAETKRSDPHLAAAISSSPTAIGEMRRILEQGEAGDFPAAELMGRFEQFLAENQQIIPAAGDALAGNDLPAFGKLVDRSQDLAERFLGNQTPETVFLARKARELGAAAASAFGAGFGGSVWALVQARAAVGFLEEWRRVYIAAFPGRGRPASFFLTQAGPAALEVT
jgi:galactokinase